MSPRSILHLRLGGTDGGGADPGLPVEPLADFCRRTTPRWELTPGGAFLDMSGTTRLYGAGLDGAALVTGLARGCWPVRAAGAGPTRLTARLASWYAARAGGGILAVRSDQVAAFLRPVPVRFLSGRPSITHRLHQLGVRNLGDLQVVPRDLLRSVFGTAGGGLADEAWGREGGGPQSGEKGGRAVLTLVVGVRVPRPVSHEPVVSALLRGLALRALTSCPGGPASRNRWRLKAFWPEHMTARSSVAGPPQRGLTSWLGLVDHLWQRLPHRRKGLLGLELAAGPADDLAVSQGHLFPDDVADLRLAEAVRRTRAVSHEGLSLASEELIRGLGAVWYDRDREWRPGGRGLVDADRSAQ